MRRLELALVLACSLGLSLLMVRQASHLLVYRGIHDRELNDFYGRPPTTTLADVRDHFGEIVDHLNPSDTTTTSPLFPLAKVGGVLEVPTIAAASLLLGVAVLCWSSRHPAARPLEALNRRTD